MKRFAPQIFLLFIAVVLSVVTHASPSVGTFFKTSTEGFYLSVALLFALGFCLNYFSKGSVISSFVWAIIFGMALQVPFSALTTNKESFVIVINLMAAFVLFAGGLAVPVKNFKKYFAPIAALSLGGTLLAVFLFAYSLAGATAYFGFTIPVISLLVLSAILSSIDPTTLIPSLEHLHFRKPFLRDIVVSEAAINDVVGTTLTRFFLVAALGTTSGVALLGVSTEFTTLFSRPVLDGLALEIVWGILVGLLGYWILSTWGESVRKTHWSDPALFLSVPIFTFALGSIIGGSGFLAAFVAGLLFESRAETHEVRQFFELLVNHFMKPAVFIILGALAPLDMLVATAGIGIVAWVIFMLFIRPLVVCVSLLPWMVQKKAFLSWKELLFLSLVRETGAIPAILLLTAVTGGLVAGDFVYALGVWVMLCTLVIEPPLTALVAQRLEIVD